MLLVGLFSVKGSGPQSPRPRDREESATALPRDGGTGTVRVPRVFRTGRSEGRVIVGNYMSKAQLDKKPVIEDFKTHASDTGSAEVQIALLTQRIVHLTEHLRTHRKDFHSRRGLIAMTSRRRKLLDYVKAHDLDKYKELLVRLKLRR